MTQKDREDAERMGAEAGKPPAPARDHPKKPFRTPNKTTSHPAPDVATDGQKSSSPAPREPDET